MAPTGEGCEVRWEWEARGSGLWCCKAEEQGSLGGTGGKGGGGGGGGGAF